jgi:hypothetical protein
MTCRRKKQYGLALNLARSSLKAQPCGTSATKSDEPVSKVPVLQHFLHPWNNGAPPPTWQANNMFLGDVFQTALRTLSNLKIIAILRHGPTACLMIASTVD